MGLPKIRNDSALTTNADKSRAGSMGFMMLSPMDFAHRASKRSWRIWKRKLRNWTRDCRPLPPSRVRLHPNLGEVYRRKVAALAETLNDTAIRTSALENIRSLISSVTIREVDGRTTIELEGAITALIALAQPKTGKDLEGSSVKVVAGA